MATTNGIQLLDEFGNPITGLQSSTGIKVSGTVTATNLSVAATGGGVPTQATYLGGNKAGNLTGALLDSSGNLQSSLWNGSIEALFETQAGLAGAFITEDQIRNLIINGKGYSVSTQKQTGFAGTGGFQFYNPSAGTKNILILSVSFGNAANVMFEMRKITADQSLLTGWTNSALIPSNLGASGAASTAVCGYSTTNVTGTFTGNYIRAFTLGGNSAGEMLANGECIWLPSGAGTLAGICLTWAETAVGFNCNVFYLEF